MKTLVESVFEREGSGKKAVICREEELSYHELCRRVRRVAAYLRKSGVTKGSRVVMSAISNVAFTVNFLAVQFLGGITVPVDRTMKVSMIETIARNCEAVLFINSGRKRHDFVKTVLSSEIAESVEAASDEADSDEVKESAERDEYDIAEFIVTSGTTGTSKCTYHSCGNIYANMINTCEGNGLDEDDVVLIPLPLNHSFGLRMLRAAFFMGGTVVLQNGTLFTKELERNIRDHACTGMAYISSAIEGILENTGESFIRNVIGKLKFIEFSAGAVPLAIRQKLVKLLPDTVIYNNWGSSETGGSIALNVSDAGDKIKALGKPVNGVKAAIYLENEKRFCDKAGEEYTGKMALSGSMVMKGYWNKSELSEKVLRNGWFITNDLVWKDSDGYYYMLGRSDDVINIAGEKINPQEIETEADKVEGINDTACLCVDDKGSAFGKKLVLIAAGSRSSGKRLIHELRETLNEEIGRASCRERV